MGKKGAIRLRNAGRVLAVATLAGTVLMLSWPSTAFADAPPDKVGWWSEVQQSSTASLPVSTATGTNLVVGNDPNGADNVAAVQYSLPAGVDPSSASATLTLSIAPNTSVGTVSLAACPIAGDWQPAQGGAWADKPNWSCASSATGTVSSDGSSVSFPLTAAVQSSTGVFSLAIVPATGAGPFQIQFTAPGASSFAVSGGSAPPAAEATPAPPDTSPAPVASPDATVAPSPVSQAVLPAVTSAGPLPVDSPVTAPAGPAAPATTPATPATAPAAGSGPALPALAAPAAAHVPSGSSNRAHRIMALALLGLLAGGMWWLGGNAARQPQLLGSLSGQPATGAAGAGGAPAPAAATGPIGGIGRFARPRQGPPRRLG